MPPEDRQITEEQVSGDRYVLPQPIKDIEDRIANIGYNIRQWEDSSFPPNGRLEELREERAELEARLNEMETQADTNPKIVLVIDVPENDVKKLDEITKGAYNILYGQSNGDKARIDMFKDMATALKDPSSVYTGEAKVPSRPVDYVIVGGEGGEEVVSWLNTVGTVSGNNNPYVKRYDPNLTQYHMTSSGARIVTSAKEVAEVLARHVEALVPNRWYSDSKPTAEPRMAKIHQLPVATPMDRLAAMTRL